MKIAIDLTDYDEMCVQQFAGRTVAQRIFHACTACPYVQRVALIAHNRNRGNIIESWYKYPAIDRLSAPLGIVSVWYANDFISGLQTAMRSEAWDRVLVLNSGTPLIFGFMLEEVCQGIQNKEYGLDFVEWAEVADGRAVTKIEKFKPRFKHTKDRVDYLYSEMDAGASWEELLEENDAEQETTTV